MSGALLLLCGLGIEGKRTWVFLVTAQRVVTVCPIGLHPPQTHSYQKAKTEQTLLKKRKVSIYFLSCFGHDDDSLLPPLFTQRELKQLEQQ
jgi:hypothetical protein